MATTTHKCPCEGCTRQVQRKLLMCIDHWRMVPKVLQQEIYRTFRAWTYGRPADRPQARREYFKVVDQAMAAIREKEVKKHMRGNAMGDVLPLD